MAIFSSLSRQQKEAVGLLQIGTFLEYFDLMLYVHMAVLLNELFFPKTDPHTASLLAAFAFCSTYALRPIGALLFGWIGDTIGRKSTVIITTMMMAFSCLVMASLPTYSQIGITAAWIVTLCRVMQGISSMGEVVGAQIYLTEIIKPPTQYRVIAIIPISLSLGCLFALAVATLVTTSGFEWRNAFWIGASIAVIGSLARTRLRETPEFLNMREKIKKQKAAEIGKNNIQWQDKFCKKKLLGYFLIDCSAPVFFYFTYIYCGTIMKNLFNYTPAEIIKQNMFVGCIDLLMCCVWLVFLTYKPYPLKILKVEFFAILPFVLLCPYILSSAETPLQLFLIQSFCTCFCLGKMAACSVFIKHFPVFKRFTFLSLSFALSRATVSIVTAFGLVYIVEALGYYGLWVIFIPTLVGFYWGLSLFEKLEKQKQPQVHTPHPLSIKPDELNLVE